MIELAALDNSPIRYPGSKARWAVRLLRLADQRKQHYVEPFAGGLGMLFRARRERLFRSYHANDVDSQLVNFWVVLRDRPRELLDQLWSWYRRYGAGDEDLFHQCKEHLVSPNDITRAAAYFVINKWSVKGDQNTGLIRTTTRQNGLSPNMLDRLPIFSELLDGVTLSNLDFRELEIPGTAFVFADSPYERVGSRFYRHTADLAEFRDWIHQLTGSWLVTLNDSPYTNELFSDFDRVIEPVTYPVVMNPASRRFRSPRTTEILVMNYKRSTRDAFLRRFDWSVRKATKRSRRATSSAKLRSAG
jgi:DNA adenine methylase